MMNTKELSYLSILFLSLLFLQAAPVNAHTPASINLDYNFGTQILTVEVSHGVTDPNSHFVIRIVVEKNSMEFTTRDFTSQPLTSGTTETFDVPTVDGDVLRVTASCNFVGDAVNSITVSDTSTTATTTDTTTTTTDTTTTTSGSTTSPTPPAGIDSTVVIIAVVAGIVVILVIVAGVRRR